MGFCNYKMVKALFFTGQGSQFVGMGKEIYEKNSLFRKTIDRAEEILEIPLKKLMFEGPEFELTLTKNAQPAILAISVGKFEVYKSEHGIEEIKYALGHSLGEFGALYAAEVIDFENVFKLVKKRGELMHKAGEKHKGTMGVALGMSEEEVKEILNKIGDTRLVLANYNAPGQYIVSGPVESVDKFIEISKKMGYRKSIKLKVSAAFHSPLMKEAAEEFSKYVEEIEFKKPIFKIIQNVTGKAHEDPKEIKENIKKQILSPVKFMDQIKFLKENGVEEGIEFGPKGILKGLVSRIDKDFNLEFFDAG